MNKRIVYFIRDNFIPVYVNNAETKGTNAEICQIFKDKNLKIPVFRIINAKLKELVPA